MMAMHTQHRCIVHVRGIDLDAGHDQGILQEQNVSWNHTMPSSFQHTSQQVIYFQS
jgi:hypothetical protein